MVKTPHYTSWGGDIAGADTQISRALSGNAALPAGPYLAYGNGRSYGDSCLPAEGALIDMRSANRILAFDPETGILKAEAGVSFAEILTLIIPHGWFLPVTPGTAQLTLGGAIANDVHGKNHHNAGTFGRFVRSFELLRSDQSRFICSLQQNPDFYSATIGGMGLTGLILWAEISLMRVTSADVDQTMVRFKHISEYFTLHCEADTEFTYSVAWIDAMARGDSLGRGLLLQANHSREPNHSHMRREKFNIPVTLPFNAVVSPGLRLLNAAYYRRSTRTRCVPFQPYFYPLDSIGGWNRLYGQKGFRQFQCLVPEDCAAYVIPELLSASLKHAGGSGLAVLKKFGPSLSPGIMSFPAPGFTLTLDFANKGKTTDRLFSDLESITMQAHGRVNAYKDSKLSQAAFEASYPRWHEMKDYLDPMAGSRFSRRIGLTSARSAAMT